MALHNATNPRIVLYDNGIGATGQFHLWCACTMRPAEPLESDVVMLGACSDRFRQADGEWLIEEFTADVRHMSERRQGRARQPWRG